MCVPYDAESKRERTAVALSSLKRRHGGCDDLKFFLWNSTVSPEFWSQLNHGGATMRLVSTTFIAFIAGSAIAFAQGQPVPNDNAPSNPAVKTTEGNNPGAPAAGANSFTEGQAKARIESRGYANVSGLAKDTNGFWRGKAMKDGKSVNVTLDYQGNVTVN
jgi:hypothetical protein